MPNRLLAFALTCLLAACGGEAEAPPPEPEPVAEPAPEPAPAPPAAEGKVPTGAKLQGWIDRADRIEARSGPGQKPTWSKDLTDADRAKLKKGLGTGEIAEGAPRCPPTVVVTLFKGDKEMAGLGAFCEDEGPIRVDIGGTAYSMTPANHKALKAALASPVDL